MTTPNRLVDGVKSLLGSPEELELPQSSLEAVAFFPRLPGVDVMTLVMTRGLSRHPLHQRAAASVRQEIMVICESRLDRIEIVALLGVVAKEVAERGHAIEKGEVFGPAGPLVSGSAMAAFFATEPMFLPPTFCLYEDGREPLIGVWLLAISSSEAVQARKWGPKKFQSYLATLGGPETFYGLLRKETPQPS